MKTPHKYAEYIKAWADGAEIECYKDYESKLVLCINPTWDEFTSYRIKPEREYPKSDLSEIDLQKLLVQNRGKCESTTMARMIADAAVRRYIQDTEEQCTK